MTKKVKIGNCFVGGGERIKIQSMTTTRTADVEQTVAQMKTLEDVGCDIVRVAITGEDDARAIKEIKKRVSLPIVADIHFSYKLALLAIDSGADKIRINPGNIGGEAEIRAVAEKLVEKKIPVRVGANTGSVEKHFLEKYGKSADALVESALSNVRILEKYGVRDIVVAVKASSVPLTVESYRKLKERTDYPLHIGVTEAGAGEMGIVKGAVGIGSLLLDGIGDTLRVSLTDDPKKEVLAGKAILRACGLDQDYVELVACPTCGRCAWESRALYEKVRARSENVKKKLKVAVMGCVVNGPGEAKDADLGIAGGDGYCLIFKKGEPYKKVKKEDAEKEFFAELERELL